MVTILSNERTQTIVCKTRRCPSERMTEAGLKRESGTREEEKGRRDEKHHGISGLLHADFQLRSSMKPCAWKAIKLQGCGAKDGTDKSTMKNRRIPEMAKWLPVPGLRGGPGWRQRASAGLHVELPLGGRGGSGLSHHSQSLALTGGRMAKDTVLDTVKSRLRIIHFWTAWREPEPCFFLITTSHHGLLVAS